MAKTQSAARLISRIANCKYIVGWWAFKSLAAYHEILMSPAH
jgi:hypothetical protein